METFCFIHAEDELHKNFAETRKVDELIHYDILAQLDSYCEDRVNEDHTLPFLIVGESGVGKSTLLSNWTARRKARSLPSRGLDYKEFLFWHAIGCSKLSTEMFHLLRRLATFLIEHFDLKEMVDLTGGRLPYILPRLLDRSSKKGRVIIVIDGGLQHISSLDEDYGLKWLPSKLPPNVRMIISVTRPLENPPQISEYDTKIQTKIRHVWSDMKRRKWPMVSLENLDHKQVSALLDRLLIFQKRDNVASMILKKQLIENIYSCECSKNALFLTYVLRGIQHAECCLSYSHHDIVKCVQFWTSKEVKCAMDLVERMLTIFESGIPRDNSVESPFLQHESNLHERVKLETLLGHSLSLLFVARHGLHENELFNLLSRVRQQLRWKKQTKDTLIPVKLKLLKMLMQKRKRLIDIYRSFDTDGNGTLSHEEFYTGMQRLDLPGVTRDDIASLINEVDENGDGEIDFVETLDHFERIFRKFLHGNRKGSVFAQDVSTLTLVARDLLSFTEDCKQKLISTLQCVGVVCINNSDGCKGSIMTLPFENTTVRNVVWKRYIKSRKGELETRSFITEYFTEKEPSLRRCEELPWHLNKSKNWISLRKILGDLKTLDTMFNTEGLKPELFHYLRRLTEGKQDSNHLIGKFDVVLEYNRELSIWYEKTKPSSSQVFMMCDFIAEVMLWFSRSISEFVQIPPFMRICLDDVEMKKLGIDMKGINEKLLMQPQTDYYYRRWIWIQFPWLALKNTSNAFESELRRISLDTRESKSSLSQRESSLEIQKRDAPSSKANENDSPLTCLSVRDKAMIRARLSMPTATIEKIEKMHPVCSTATAIHSRRFFSQSKVTGTDNVDDSYLKLNHLKEIHDSLVVEALKKNKYLKELDSALTKKNHGEDQNSHGIAAGKAVIEKMHHRLDQIKKMLAQVSSVEIVHKQILMALQSSQPCNQKKHHQLEQEITLSKQQIVDLRRQQANINEEIEKIQTNSHATLSEIKLALDSKQNILPDLETLRTRLREAEECQKAERQKSDRMASFDSVAFSRRLKMEGIIEKRRVKRKSDRKETADAESSVMVHPMQILAHTVGSYDPLAIFEKKKEADYIKSILGLTQEQQELQLKEQQDILNDLQREIKEIQLKDRTETIVTSLTFDEEIGNTEALPQTREANLQHINALINTVSKAVQRLMDLSISIENAFSNDRLAELQLDTNKSHLKKDAIRLVQSIRVIHHTFSDEDSLISNDTYLQRTQTGHDVHEGCSKQGNAHSSGSIPELFQNTRVLNKAGQELNYSNMTKILHDKEDENRGTDELCDKEEHNTENDCEKMANYVLQSIKTNACEKELRRANLLSNAKQGRFACKGLILEAVMQSKI